MRIAVERGRGVKPELKLGICGEHGGEPRVGRVLPRARPRLRLVLAVPRAARAPRRGAGRAGGARRHRGRRRRLIRAAAGVRVSRGSAPRAHGALRDTRCRARADRGFGDRGRGRIRREGGRRRRSGNTGPRFQACSISKPVAVLGMLRLVEQGVLDLDADVNEMLMSWRVPPNASWQPRVTLRQIASHSAGLTVGGFPGYARRAALPTLREILTGSPRRTRRASGSTRCPGIEFRYAGGGTTVLQQVLEDVTGRPFAKLMRELVLDPSGCPAAPTRSRCRTSCTPTRRRRTGGRKSGGQRLARVPGARRRGPVDDAATCSLAVGVRRSRRALRRSSGRSSRCRC